MSLNLYLTIDDSPSERTDDLVAFLNERKIPALLFVRGDNMEHHGAAVTRAIKAGMIIGNHSHSHVPAGDMSFEEWCADFEKCEALINAAYAAAGVKRTGHYYRFPYVDRGDGVRVERAFAEHGEGGFTDNEAVARIQGYLHKRGFTQPFTNMPAGYPSDAVDCLFTYTSGDWMLTKRHLGLWDYKCVDDLKKKMDSALTDEGVHHVVLMHDQAEIFHEVCALIDYLQQKGACFLDFKNDS